MKSTQLFAPLTTHSWKTIYNGFLTVAVHINDKVLVHKLLINVNCLTAQYAYTLAWSRSDGGRLPSHVMDDGQGSLYIRNVQPSDEGTYLCTGSNYYSVATDEAVLEIGC